MLPRLSHQKNTGKEKFLLSLEKYKGTGRGLKLEAGSLKWGWGGHGQLGRIGVGGWFHTHYTHKWLW